MAVRRKGSQWQADIMIKGNRFRKAFSQSRDAENWEDELRRRKSLGLDIGELVNDEPEISLEEAMEKTYNKYWKNTDSAYGNYQKMKEIMNYFPRGTLLKDVTTTALDDFIEWLAEKGNADATINNKLNVISKTFTWARIRGVFKDTPHIERKKLSNNKPRFFLEDEVIMIRNIFLGPKQILREVPNELYLDYFDFCLDSGMRSAEAQVFDQTTDMRRDPTLGWVVDIDETKNDLYRCNPMTERMVDIVQKYPDVPQPFFEINQKRRYKAWVKVREVMDNDDPEFIMYLTRHTCASRLVQSGVNLLAVKKYLGHRKIETTMRYASIRPDDLLFCTKALQNQEYQLSN